MHEAVSVGNKGQYRKEVMSYALKEEWLRSSNRDSLLVFF